MDKKAVVQAYVDEIFSHMDKNKRITSYHHTGGVAQFCALLAEKRGLDSETASICGLLHDVYLPKSGKRILHAVNGAEMVRVAFKHELNGLFSDEEQMLIRSAIFHHSDKAHIHDAYEEVLKDADLLQHWLWETVKERQASPRIVNLQKELGLPVSELPESHPPKILKSDFSRAAFADIAETLAAKKVTGVKTDADFMNIIGYFPEKTAFDELKNAWCAAFAFHCAVTAGLKLPIRYAPTSNTRFACVEAWLEWGQNNGFCGWEKDAFIPERGDIVIYNNVIPPESKPENGPWYDHIGIVLTVNEHTLTAAEGNVNNRNVSGIVERARDGHIGCYVRIPEDYIYDGWKYDYKTGKPRQEEYR